MSNRKRKSDRSLGISVIDVIGGAVWLDSAMPRLHSLCNKLLVFVVFE